MNKFDVVAFHFLGELYLKRNDMDKASEFFDKAMHISPRNAGRGVQFGKVLIRQGAVRKALNVFDTAIALSDSAMGIQEEVADFCIENGLYEYAEKNLEFLLQQMPSRQDIIYKLGRINEKQGQFRKALSYFIEVGKRDRDNTDIQLKIAQNYIAFGQVLRAEQLLNGILRKDPENEAAKALLISRMAMSPAWRMPATMAASAPPFRKTSAMCRTFPAPPEATTGMRTLSAIMRVKTKS